MDYLKHKVNIALQILPKSNNKDSYKLIDKAIEVIQQSGIKYEVCPFETVMEGYYDDIMLLIKKVHNTCFESGAEELIANVKMQIHKNNDVFIEDKTGKYRE